jgi:predicted PolB exonuclease-like 3'-5' exonuclease
VNNKSTVNGDKPESKQLAHDVIIWDLETVPDLAGFAQANGLVGKLNEEIRSAMGDDFPKLIYHSIVCIGALVATKTEDGYEVRAFGASHVGEQTERDSFDLPVLRYRTMIHEIAAPGMDDRAYFHRYRDDTVDLCDVLASFSYGGKAKLNELSRVMGLDGKPEGMDGSQVEAYFNAGRIQEIADYCQSDVVNTYRFGFGTSCFGGGSTGTSSSIVKGCAWTNFPMRLQSHPLDS